MADDPFLTDIQNALGQPQQSPSSAAPSQPAQPIDPMLGDIQGALSGHLNRPAATDVSTEDFYGRLAAAAQGTSPVGRYTLAPPEHQAIFNEQQLIPNQQTEVALPDPQHPGKFQLYMRSPETAQGRLSGLAEVAPYMMPSSVPAVATLGALSKSQGLLQDYERLGIPPTPPAVGQGQAAGLISQGAQRIPFAGPPVQRAVEASRVGTAQAAERIAGTYGEATLPQEAGRIVEEAIPSWEKSNAAKSTDLYNRAQSLIDPTAQVPLPNALSALRAPMAEFPSSEALGKLHTKPQFAADANAIDEAGGGLTMPEVSRLRSGIGAMMKNPQLRGDISEGELSQVYRGYTDDMRNFYASQGPEALQAFDNATNFYRQSRARLDVLGKVFGSSSENTFASINTMAGTKRGANATALSTLRDSMPADEWGDVASTAISQMGQPTANAKDVIAAHGNFSPSSFVTNWSKLSDAAKDTLFGADTPGSNREALESLVRVAGSQKNVARLSNVSHSAELGLSAAGIFEVGRELLSEGFRPGAALGVIGGAFGANMTSRLLMTPSFARWLYGLPSLYGGVPPGQAVTAVAGRLSQFMRAADPLTPSGGP